jgi:hypothetical protein
MKSLKINDFVMVVGCLVFGAGGLPAFGLSNPF